MPIVGTVGSLTATGYGYIRSANSYSISPSTTYVNEGSSVTFTVEAIGSLDGTVLYWTVKSVSGTVNASDFVSGSTSGSFTVTNQEGTVSLTLSNDATTEGPESFQLQIRTSSISGEIVAESQVIFVNDTSIIPAYIGTYLFKSARNFKGTGSDWTIPPDTTHIWVRMSGSGGQGENFSNSFQGGNGGAGGFTQGVMSVTAGSTYKVAVGTLANNGGTGPSISRGGGFSGILSGPPSPTAPNPQFTAYLIAGGGGGGQVNTNFPSFPAPTGAAGAGGGSYGQPGSPSGGGGPSPGGPATGGTPVSGGTYPGNPTYNGSYLQGGPGPDGGAGGGYYGGAGSGYGGGAGGSGYIGGAYSYGATYTGNRRAVSAQMFEPDYPLLGLNPIWPTVPWGYGGEGGNGPNNSSQGRGNGFVIIHCFRRAPSLSDFPGTFNVIQTY